MTLETPNPVVAPLSTAALRALAPTNLISYRTMRYQGDNISIGMADLVEPDRQLVAQLYTILRDIHVILEQGWQNPSPTLQLLHALMQRVDWNHLIQKIRTMGNATLATRRDDMVRKVVHDLKGGAFLALSMQLQMLELGLMEEESLLRAFFLVRDHTKIMRNAIRDLDTDRYETNRSPRYHNVELLIEKWSHARHHVPDATVEIVLDCQFTGSVAERCLEFAALDRIIYNLINNAARHTSDQHVYFVILPLDGDPPHDLRLVIYNRITPDHRAQLQAKHGSNVGALFNGGFTTGGSGLGMRICADFVANAYGIATIAEGLAQGYFGAMLRGDYFVNWVHWPVAAE